MPVQEVDARSRKCAAILKQSRQPGFLGMQVFRDTPPKRQSKTILDQEDLCVATFNSGEHFALTYLVRPFDTDRMLTDTGQRYINPFFNYVSVIGGEPGNVRSARDRRAVTLIESENVTFVAYRAAIHSFDSK